MDRLCSEISKIENANFFSHKFRKLFTQNNTLTSEYMTTKMMESYFIKTIFCNVIIGTVFWGFSEYLPIIKKNPKWTPKNQKFKNLSTTH